MQNALGNAIGCLDPDGLEACMQLAHLDSEDFLFPSRLHDSDHLSTREYARIVKAWVTSLGLTQLCTVFTRYGEPRHR